jgi:transcription-repair coupling factor (superfamily II helicase)
VGALPDIRIHVRQADPAASLKTFLDGFDGRVLIAAESAGRREFLIDSLRPFGLTPAAVDDWQAFLDSDARLAITVAPIEDGMRMSCCGLAVITESGAVRRTGAPGARRKRPTRDSDAIIRNLTDLHPGAPVVHEDHGVGRYLGLQILAVGGQEAEFLTLEYAGGDKLYVPVASLHLISRYTGADTEHAPLHKLGGEQWARIRRKAAEKARDVAAELLDDLRPPRRPQGPRLRCAGHRLPGLRRRLPRSRRPRTRPAPSSGTGRHGVDRPMDRVVCGDVGFGKTEVAMRAAFVAANSGQQVAVLVPTTLLAQQHYQNFTDRFADWPIRIESLSRFRSGKETETVLEGLADGRVDIVIGTHKLIQGDVKFKRLGLVIIDEEHRFGVRHKERLKALRAEVDMLTLTATPDPAHAEHGALGPARPVHHRHPAHGAPGHQDLHQSVERCADPGGHHPRDPPRRPGLLPAQRRGDHREDGPDLAELVPRPTSASPTARCARANLERVMLDFYHRRHNVLVCTTIVESGIDVPTANTIVINRADKLGLSQLHQLRGRVGRSHHRAYAYLITPHPSAMTADAVKRLEAIESLEDLGVGFTLASHDLEIRGAGELLGEDQSGQIQEIGFTLYNELLDRAVRALKKGEVPDLDRPLADVTEVDLGVPALLPDDYVPDVHTRLILYKRIASCESEAALRELQVEMIDRFGLLPTQAKNLMEVTHLRLRLQPMGVRKLEVGPQGGRFTFQPTPRIDPARLIALIQSEPKKFKLDPEQRLRFLSPWTRWSSACRP